MASRETVLPKVRKLGFLSADAEDSGAWAKLAPACAPQAPHFGKRRVQSFAYDFTAAQTDFVDPVRFSRISAVAHVIDQEHPDLWQGQKRLACPFLDQVGWGHHRPAERAAGAVDKHASEGDQGFASPAFCDDIPIAANCQRLRTPIMASV